MIESYARDHRDRMRRYMRDMAVSVAISTYKDAIADVRDPRDASDLIHRVAELAADIAIERYEGENRIVLMQADSFTQAAYERNYERTPMILNEALFAAGKPKP